MRREATGNSRKQAGQNLRAVQDVQSRNSEAKKRLGLCVLNYMVTSNHVHLLGKAMHREVEQFEETHVLREESEVYGFKSAVFWNESFEDART